MNVYSCSNADDLQLNNWTDIRSAKPHPWKMLCVCVPCMHIFYNLVSSNCKLVAVLRGTISDCLIKDARGFPFQKWSILLLSQGEIQTVVHNGTSNSILCWLLEQAGSHLYKAGTAGSRVWLEYNLVFTYVVNTNIKLCFLGLLKNVHVRKFSSTWCHTVLIAQLFSPLSCTTCITLWQLLAWPGRISATAVNALFFCVLKICVLRNLMDNCILDFMPVDHIILYLQLSYKYTSNFLHFTID